MQAIDACDALCNVGGRDSGHTGHRFVHRKLWCCSKIILETFWYAVVAE